MPETSSLIPEWYKFSIKDPPDDGSADVASLQLHAAPSLRTGELQGHMMRNTNHTANEYTDLSGAISYHGVIRLCVALLSVLSNLLILSLILIKRNLRDCMANVLVCHLGILGLSHTILLVPTYTSLVFSYTWHHAAILCIFQGYMGHVFTTSTLLTLAAISIEKYRTITEPLHYSTSVSKQKMALCLVVIWISSFLLCTLPAVVGPGYTYSQPKACCDIEYDHIEGGIPRWVTLPVLVITFYIPGGVLLFCYCRIFFIARGHRKRISAMLAMVTLSFQAPITRSTTSPSKEQKASRTISVYLGSFFICYMPYSMISILQITLLIPLNPHLVATVTSLYHCAPLINALVYGTMNKSLRSCVVNAIKRTRYSRHDVNQRNGMREVLSTPLLSRAQLIVNGDRRNSLMLAKVERLQREVGIGEVGEVLEVEQRPFIFKKMNGATGVVDVCL